MPESLPLPPCSGPTVTVRPWSGLDRRDTAAPIDHLFDQTACRRVCRPASRKNLGVATLGRSLWKVGLRDADR